MSCIRGRAAAPGVFMLLLLSAGLPVGAAPAAPEDLEATYDTATETVTLMWSWGGTLAAGDAFRIYINGFLEANVTVPTYDDDVSTWDGGVRVYQVSVVVTGDESEKAGPVVVNGYIDPGQCTPGDTVVTPQEVLQIVSSVLENVVFACLRGTHPDAPYGLSVQYDPASGEFTIAWLHARPQAVSEYRVYRDDTLIATLQQSGYVDDVPWEGISRTYRVSAVVDGQEHSGETVQMVGVSPPDWDCMVVTVFILPPPPSWQTYPECIPPLGG